MKILLAHPGTQHSYQLAKQLHRKGILFRFHTGIAYGKDHWFYKLAVKLPVSIFSKISTRFIDGVPDAYVRRHFLNEFIQIIGIKLGKDEELSLFKRNNRFQKSIPAKEIEGSDVIIGFDTSSAILIERCHQLNKPFILDVSIGHPASKDKVYKSLLQQYPDWNFTIKQKPDWYIQIEEQEMKTADAIVVASSFTLHTYGEHGVDERKIAVNQYGVDIEKLQPVINRSFNNRPLRFAFVGLVDSRKGVPFLLETWAKFSNASLTLIGPISAATEKLVKEKYPLVIIKGRIPFSQLSKELPTYDVLVFPSFFEGYGLVVPEAMACGLPVITTTATCGPDIIENGKEGFIINPGDTVALINAIQYFIDQPSSIKTMGAAAREKVMNLNWDHYGDNWETIISNTIKRKNEAVRI